MLSFPNAKINIGLRITGKRADGFHDLETVFFPVAIRDAVEIIGAADGKESFSVSGVAPVVMSEDNICIKAYRLLKKDFPFLPALQMHLHKTIPIGAGLGGGSADGTATLELLDKMFGLQISAENIAAYALMLGSDCPFFLLNKPALATGRGELLTPLSLDLSAFQIVVVNPRIHVNTAAAFAALGNSYSPAGETASAVSGHVSDWKDTVVNDFEKTVFQIHPLLADIKQKMYSRGAVYSAMSGSGSSIYGLFSGEAPRDFNFPPAWFCRTV